MTDNRPQNQTFPSAGTPAMGSNSPVRIPSERLFQAGREVVIVHNGRDYRLRLTQYGKLILTA
ncbi:MAG: hemin uptake protein HemP [Betaproteobacteria bacterium]|nr:hemin uptake protein HemP [Betaproteobacteria bacterium]